MKTKRLIWSFALAVCGAVSLLAQTTVFTYQGRLNDGANLAEGTYDLQFAIHDAPTNGVVVAGPMITSPVAVSSGLFTVQLDFGAAAFNGADRWLEIAVRTNGASGFTTLSPRQMITSTPYALFAAKASIASLASSVAASNITGLIQQAQLPFDVLFNGATGVSLSGSFSGNGSGLNNLNASNLGSGVVADGLLSPNVAFLNGTNVFAGTNRFTSVLLASNTDNQISGNFSGDGSGLNNLNASNLASGAVSDLRLSANVAFLHGTNIFAGTNQFANVLIATNPANQIAGVFTGGGAGITDVNASTLSGVGASGFWQIGGNTGTSAGSNFLGTTDNQPLEFKVNGLRALRLEPGSQGTPNFIGGHPSNNVSVSGRHGVVISGGGEGTLPNVATSDFAFIGSGRGNRAGAFGSVVGGFGNTALGLKSFVGGGSSNTNLAESSVIGGGDQNTILAGAATIGGGDNNQIRENSVVSVIAGGFQNTIGTNAFAATISGGNGNRALDDYSTVGGGALNEAGGYASTVGGGYANKSSGVEATVSGGDLNSSSGDWSAILGGFFNEAAGYASTVAGGYINHATGSYSFAAGRQAVAAHPGAFVWADSQLPPFSSTADNQFSIRAAGGFRLEGDQASAFFTSLNHRNGSVLTLGNLTDSAFYLGAINFANKDDVVGQIAYLANHSMKFSLGGGGGMIIDGSGTLTVSSPSQSSARFTVDANANLNFGAETRQMLNLWNAEYGIGVQAATEYFRTSGGFSWFHGGVHSSGERNPGGGDELMYLSASGDLTIAGTFGNFSDRNAKENFETVNGREILDKVVALPISEWNYKTGRESRHIGPMAQDFYAAFGLGVDDKHITTVDADGVALAAIKGLNAKLEENVQKLEAENIKLKARLEKLELLISKLSIQ